MQFLAPLFLAGLLAVAIPIVLHLVQREKRQAVPFPSTMFLSRIPHKSTRKRRLRDLPLLILRVAALVLLAAAFARPLFQRGRPSAAAAPGREVVLQLDRSYSMRYAGHWEAARAAALREIDALGPADRMTVVAFDAGAAALNQPTGEKARLRALVTGVQPGWGATRFEPALRVAADRLGASNLPRREAVLVSDLQRLGAAEGLEAHLPAGATLRVAALPPAVRPNLAVAGVAFRRAEFSGQERVTPSARVVNTSDQPVAGARLSLELDGRTAATSTVTLAPHAAASVELPPFTLAAPVRGTFALDADALPADDARHFALAPGQALRVLVLDGRPGASLFLSRALAVGGQPGFALTVRTGALAAADLRDRDVVVLDDAPAPAGEAMRLLRGFVQNGGGLVVALGPASGTSADLDALLPGRVGPVRDRTAGGGAPLGAIDLAHPVFDVFRAPHSGDLTAPRFYRYRPLQVAAGQDSAVAVVARFDDGGVALAERRMGRGRVLALGAPLDREWSDLPVQPVFVPFVHQLVRRAAGFEPPQASRTVGEVVDARAAARAGEQVPLVAVGPDGLRREIAPGARALPLDQAGFYTIRRADRTGGAPLGTVAANVDVRESDLTAIAAAELTSMVTTPGKPALAGGVEATASPAEREKSQALWWYLLVVVTALLAAESLLSNRRARARAQVGG